MSHIDITPKIYHPNLKKITSIMEGRTEFIHVDEIVIYSVIQILTCISSPTPIRYTEN